MDLQAVKSNIVKLEQVDFSSEDSLTYSPKLTFAKISIRSDRELYKPDPK